MLHIESNEASPAVASMTINSLLRMRDMKDFCDDFCPLDPHPQKKTPRQEAIAESSKNCDRDAEV